MKRLMLCLSLAALLSSAAHADETAIGHPAKPADAVRTVTITMSDANGTMRFEPASFKVRKGETVRLLLINRGGLEHEFVMDSDAHIQAHRAMMKAMPTMEHDEPNEVRLPAGKSGQIVWTFTHEGEFEFACLIPGHYESGMTEALEVSGAASSGGKKARKSA